MAPRPKKPRNFCCNMKKLGTQVFKPAGIPLPELELTKIFPDELEAMHLCDSLCLTQQQAGERMGLSRGTVQRLVARGRKKLVGAILAGRGIVLSVEEVSPDRPEASTDKRC